MNFVKTTFVFAASTVFSLVMAGEVKPYDQKSFDQLTSQGKPVLVAVHASWCPTCKAQRPIVEDLMKQNDYKDVITLMIDFDSEKPLLTKHKVSMQSTLIAFKGSTEVGRSVGDTTHSGIEGLVKKTVN